MLVQQSSLLFAPHVAARPVQLENGDLGATLIDDPSAADASPASRCEPECVGAPTSATDLPASRCEPGCVGAPASATAIAPSLAASFAATDRSGRPVLEAVVVALASRRGELPASLAGERRTLA